MISADSIYRRAPIAVQNLLLNAYALRLTRLRRGARFEQLQRAWESSARWAPDRLRQWQDERVVELVRFAYRNVPYYRRRFDEHGVDLDRIRGAADLHLLPILTKEDVRNAGDDLLAARRRRGLIHGHTSGTTGSPLSLWYDREMCVANDVADWRQKRWAGMTADDWCGVFLGRTIVPLNQTRPPFWRTNYVHRQVWFSSFHMSEEHLERYVREVRDRRLRYLEGYPSTLYILARHIVRSGTHLPMAAVFTSSETLHAVQREEIEAAFQCRIHDFYGMAERVIFAAECGSGEGKHLFDEYGVTEIVDDDGRPVPDGTPGWLVGTGLWNRGMPLIRYRTSDMTRRLPEPCPCGRTLGRIAGVATKAEDIVVTPDGRYISPSILTHPFKPFDQLVKSQIVQEAADYVIVKLVHGTSFTAEHRAALADALQSRLGGAVRIDLVSVPDIPPERSGKFRWVISRVPHACGVPWES